MKYGGIDDVEAIKVAICSGIKGIFTAHGKNLEEIIKNPELNQLVKENLVDKVIQLSMRQKGIAEKIYDLKTQSNILKNEDI